MPQTRAVRIRDADLPDDVIAELVRMMYESRIGIRIMIVIMVMPTIYVVWRTGATWALWTSVAFWLACAGRVVVSEAYAAYADVGQPRNVQIAWQNAYGVIGITCATTFAVFTGFVVSWVDDPLVVTWVVGASVGMGYGPGPYVSLRPDLGRIQVAIPFLGPAIPFALSGSEVGLLVAVFLTSGIVSVLGHCRVEYARTVTALLSRSRSERLATTDALTGLWNRRQLEAVVRQALNEAFPNLNWLGVDLDRFKSVNDEFGHEAGDKVLRVAAQRIQSVAGPDAFVARVGGDEFVVLLIGTRERARLVADGIALHLAGPIDVPKGVARIGASVGTTRICPRDTIDEIARRADERMYARKASRQRAA